jgi:hypothetical protein
MTPRRTLLCPALVLMIVGGPLLGPVAAQSEPSNLCSGDPCVVTADASVDAGSMLDFGPRVLVLAEGVAVTLAVGDGSGTLEIHAAEIIFEPGAKISAGGIDQSSLHFEATEGSILLRSERSNRSEIDVGAGGTMAGSIKLLALADVTADGRLTAVASGEDAVGGSIQITAGGNVAISQEIRTEARDGASSSGGDVRIEAGGGISIAAGMILSGSGVGGSLLASALESIVLSASVTSDGLGPEGFAGQISLEAGGDLQLTSTGALEGSGGSGGADECGDGSETELRAGGSILLEGSIETAGGFDCRGAMSNSWRRSMLCSRAGRSRPEPRAILLREMFWSRPVVRLGCVRSTLREPRVTPGSWSMRYPSSKSRVASMRAPKAGSTSLRPKGV